MKTHSLIFLLPLLLSSCFGTKLRKSGGAELLRQQSTIVAKPGGKFEAKLVYTGCGGMAIASGRDAILFDPYYTGHNGFRVLFGIRPDTVIADTVLNTIGRQIQPAKIKTLLLSHSHYDHMEDLPWVLRTNKVEKEAKVMGSPTALSIMSSKLYNRSPVNLDTVMYKQAPSQTAYAWQQLPGNMRLLAIEADHAPHWHGVHLMRCKKGCKKVKNCGANIKHLGKRTCAFKWKEGTTYSFLLDIFSPDSTDTLRIFIQTSSCNPPNGFPPAAELGKKKVDLALLCAASFQWINNYPESILSLLKPGKTLLVHRENFFRPLYKRRVAKTVPGTNMRKLMKRLRKHYKVDNNKNLQPFIEIARPLELVDVKY